MVNGGEKELGSPRLHRHNYCNVRLPLLVSSLSDAVKVAGKIKIEEGKWGDEGILPGVIWGSVTGASFEVKISVRQRQKSPVFKFTEFKSLERGKRGRKDFVLRLSSEVYRSLSSGL